MAHIFEADYSNEVHHFAVTQSEYLSPHKEINDNWLIRLRNPRIKIIFNRAFKLFIYTLTDDYSGYRLCRYGISENLTDQDIIFFLKWAWEKNPEHSPFRGLPKALFISSKLSKNNVLNDFCRRANVRIINYELYGARKIASNFKSVRSFERSLNLFYPTFKDFDVYLSNLNQKLFIFWHEENQKQHRRFDISREAAWIEGIRQDKLFDIEPGTWEEVYSKELKHLDDQGCFDFLGKTYILESFKNSDIYLCEKIVTGELFIIDPKDGSMINL